MSEIGNRRLNAACGIAGTVLLLFAVGVLGDTPDPHDAQASIADYFVRHQHQTYISFAIASAAAVLLMIFFVGLRLRLHPVESPIAATVALIAALGVLGSLMLNELLYLAFGWQIAAANPETVKPLFVLTILGPLIQGPLVATMLVASGTASRRSMALPRWHSIVGFIAAPVMACAGLAFAQTRYFSPDVQQQVVGQLFLLWILVTAVLCLRTPAAASTLR
jgi:hypothetical protein